MSEGTVQRLFCGILLALALTLTMCGEEGPGKSGVVEDGNLVLKNDTGSRMAVQYEDRGAEPIELIVESGETKVISQETLKGGTKLTVTVRAMGASEPEADIPIEIDGETTIEVVSFGIWGENDLEYRVRQVKTGQAGGSTGRKGRDGRILLLNETSRDMDVSYVHPDEGQIDTTVPAGDKLDVSKAVLEGGSEVSVFVEAVTSTRPWANITVKIDGNVTIRITSLGAWGANALEYLIQ